MNTQLLLDTARAMVADDKGLLGGLRPGRKLFIFDLDGTLAESKAALDAETKLGIHKAYGIKKSGRSSASSWRKCFSPAMMSSSTGRDLLGQSKLTNAKVRCRPRQTVLGCFPRCALKARR